MIYHHLSCFFLRINGNFPDLKDHFGLFENLPSDAQKKRPNFTLLRAPGIFLMRKSSQMMRRRSGPKRVTSGDSTRKLGIYKDIIRI